MEILFLLSSIIYNTLLSFTFSLFLPFQYLYNYFFHQPKLSIPITRQSEENPELILYQGSVWHERKRPVYHSFRYDARYALLNLDCAPQTLPSSYFENHLSANQARHITSTNGPVFLLTIPPSVGYEQNPLSVYYCYELEGSATELKKCIAEVTNTPWGERVSFIFDPHSDIVAKPLHVSPFMDMLGNWSMKANEPGDNLFLAISVQHPKLGDFFTATLTAKRVSSGASSPTLFFWLMPQKVALWIYWQALKLWWKNVQFIQHPRYLYPKYREEASLRNRILQCCQAAEEDENSRLKIDKSHSNGVAAGDTINRWCVWKDAQWPWN
ncbi:hypothetical protein AQUCO_02200218v1 [Aquilegia coerulea]|uniref:DUF1365 domain-containing protein n=1 Tax=Aquilegia coerulea TaxID=218851 RepID=A0A2G5DDS6_AQUCA|nr:hypothetical protein AQUCO_02200218v1 [Aquilegia coerulea]